MVRRVVRVRNGVPPEGSIRSEPQPIIFRPATSRFASFCSVFASFCSADAPHRPTWQTDPFAKTHSPPVCKLVGRTGPEISERTRNTLRRFDLEDRYESDSVKCFDHIRKRVNDHPDADLIYALSELSYVEGKKAERQGHVSDALNHYGIALTNSYDYLFSDDLGATRNEYDPQFRAVCDLYNESLEDTLRLLCSDNKIEPGQTYTITHAYERICRSDRDARSMETGRV